MRCRLERHAQLFLRPSPGARYAVMRRRPSSTRASARASAGLHLSTITTGKKLSSTGKWSAAVCTASAAMCMTRPINAGPESG